MSTHLSLPDQVHEFSQLLNGAHVHSLHLLLAFVGETREFGHQLLSDFRTDEYDTTLEPKHK